MDSSPWFIYISRCIYSMTVLHLFGYSPSCSLRKKRALRQIFLSTKVSKLSGSLFSLLIKSATSTSSFSPMRICIKLNYSCIKDTVKTRMLSILFDNVIFKSNLFMINPFVLESCYTAIFSLQFSVYIDVNWQ